jgi:hypothetical protein
LFALDKYFDKEKCRIMRELNKEPIKSELTTAIEEFLPTSLRLLIS